MSSLPKFALPTSVKRWAPSLPTTVTVSPSLNPSSLNAFADSASSSDPRGARPETNENGSSGLGCVDRTKLTLPPILSPWALRIVTSSWMPPAATFTPSTPRTRATMPSLSGGGSSSNASSTFFGAMTTSVPEFACVKTSEKDLLIVSVRT